MSNRIKRFRKNIHPVSRMVENPTLIERTIAFLIFSETLFIFRYNKNKKKNKKKIR